jgi:hypothetical protein
MQKKPLTGWLILLIVLLGPLTLGQASALFAQMDASYTPLVAQFPSLPQALRIFKLLMGISVCVSIFTAWVLFRRRPGSLGVAQAGLVFRAVFMIVASIAFQMLAGLPPDVTQANYHDLALSGTFVFLLTGVWYLYLIRSKRVLEIYAD